MKNTLSLLALAAALVSANAQTYIAGWDFGLGNTANGTSVSPTPFNSLQGGIPGQGGFTLPGGNGFELVLNNDTWADDNNAVWTANGTPTFDDAGFGLAQELVPPANTFTYGSGSSATAAYTAANNGATPSGTAAAQGFNSVGGNIGLEFRRAAVGGFFSFYNGTNLNIANTQFEFDFRLNGTQYTGDTFNIYVSNTSAADAFLGSPVATFTGATSYAAKSFNLGDVNAGDYIVITLGTYSGSGAITSNTSQYLRFDNFVVRGTPSIVPEPSVAGLFAAVALLIARRRA